MGEYKYDHMWITDLDKYDSYPKSRIELCNKKLGVDLKQIAFDNNKMIIP